MTGTRRRFTSPKRGVNEMIELKPLACLFLAVISFPKQPPTTLLNVVWYSTELEIVLLEEESP
jgi:hypothetical protein